MALSEDYVTLAKEDVIFESRRIGSHVDFDGCSKLHTPLVESFIAIRLVKVDRSLDFGDPPYLLDNDT